MDVAMNEGLPKPDVARDGTFGVGEFVGGGEREIGAPFYQAPARLATS